METFIMKSSKPKLSQLFFSVRISLFHSVAVLISAVNVYAFLYNLEMVEIDAHLVQLMEKHIRINPWKYITFWNMVLQTLYFSLALLTDVMGLDTTLKSNQRRLQYIRDLSFASLLFPIGTWVCSSFWVLYWLYSELILPDKMALLMPFWVNHGTHSMPAIFAVLELCLVRHKYPNRYKGILCVTALYVGYLLYMVSSSLSTGVWPYPILTELPPTHLIVIISTLIVSALLQYIIGENLNILLWKQCSKKRVPSPPPEQCSKKRVPSPPPTTTTTTTTKSTKSKGEKSSQSRPTKQAKKKDVKWRKKL